MNLTPVWLKQVKSTAHHDSPVLFLILGPSPFHRSLIIKFISELICDPHSSIMSIHKVRVQGRVWACDAVQPFEPVPAVNKELNENFSLSLFKTLCSSNNTFSLPGFAERIKNKWTKTEISFVHFNLTLISMTIVFLCVCVCFPGEETDSVLRKCEQRVGRSRTLKVIWTDGTANNEVTRLRVSPPHDLWTSRSFTT